MLDIKKDSAEAEGHAQGAGISRRMLLGIAGKFGLVALSIFSLPACGDEAVKPEDDPRVKAIPKPLEPVRAYESNKEVDARIEQLLKELRDELGTPTERRIFDKRTKIVPVQVKPIISPPPPRPSVATPKAPPVIKPEVLPPKAVLNVPDFSPMANPNTLREKRRELQKLFLQTMTSWTEEAFRDLDAEYAQILHLTDKVQRGVLSPSEQSALAAFMKEYDNHISNYGELRSLVGEAQRKLALLKKYPQLFAAISAEESGWGGSEWAREANNYFGLQRRFTEEQQKRYKNNPQYKQEFDQQYMIVGKGKKKAFRFDHPSESVQFAIENIILSKNRNYQEFFEVLQRLGELNEDVLLWFAKGYNEHPEEYIQRLQNHMKTSYFRDVVESSTG